MIPETTLSLQALVAKHFEAQTTSLQRLDEQLSKWEPRLENLETKIKQLETQVELTARNGQTCADFQRLLANSEFAAELGQHLSDLCKDHQSLQANQRQLTQEMDQVRQEKRQMAAEVDALRKNATILGTLLESYQVGVTNLGTKISSGALALDELGQLCAILKTQVALLERRLRACAQPLPRQR